LLLAEHVEYACAVMWANENCAVSTAANGISSMERLRRALIRGSIPDLTVPLSNRSRHMFFAAKKVRVHADPSQGRKPYVGFWRVRYISTELQRRYDLHNQWVYARADPDDERVIYLYNEAGIELCRAHGEGRWGIIPHDARMRRMALNGINKAEFEEMPHDGPLLALFASLQRDASKSPAAALKLAHCIAVLGRAMEGRAETASLVAAILGEGSTLEAATYLGEAANSADGQGQAGSPAQPAAAQPPTGGAPTRGLAPTSASPPKLVPRNAIRRAAA
jgi:hypothetical protein